MATPLLGGGLTRRNLPREGLSPSRYCGHGLTHFEDGFVNGPGHDPALLSPRNIDQIVGRRRATRRCEYGKESSVRLFSIPPRFPFCHVSQRRV